MRTCLRSHPLRRLPRATFHRVRSDAAGCSVMVVVITSTGISKFLRAFNAPVDSGLVNWAAEYLNDRVGGLPSSADACAAPHRDGELGARERVHRTARPAFAAVRWRRGRALCRRHRKIARRPPLRERRTGERLMALIEERVALVECCVARWPSARRSCGSVTRTTFRAADAFDCRLPYGDTQRRLGSVSVMARADGLPGRDREVRPSRASVGSSRTSTARRDRSLGRTHLLGVD